MDNGHYGQDHASI